MTSIIHVSFIMQIILLRKRNVVYWPHYINGHIDGNPETKCHYMNYMVE